MWHCSREVKCHQDDTLHTCLYVCDLMVRVAELYTSAVYTLACKLQYCEVFVKANDGRDRRPDYAIFVVFSASCASGKTLECEVHISSSRYYEHLLFTRL